MKGGELMTKAKRNLELCRELENIVYSNKLTKEQRDKAKRNALRLKIEAWQTMNKKSVFETETCERGKDLSKFRAFATFCKASEMLEKL